MGISSNQARFLTLTSRQIDLEYRVQQICQRRLRLASELERISSEYNNQISNRAMYTYNTTNMGISQLTVSNINAIKDANGNTFELVYKNADGDLARITTNNLLTATVNGGATLQEQVGLDGSTLTGDDLKSAVLEAAIRAGLVSIATKEDVYTQDAYAVDGLDGNYELRDWRTLSQIADELYKGDNADAENTYEKVTAEVNAQDKKLQLEQTAIEVEYKAVTTEKEAVKKILDTNAQASFKYFS